MSALHNSPDIWLGKLPRIHNDGHKYHRGHAVIYGAPELTGATRLAATACARIGAGLTTVMAKEKGDVYRTSLPAHIMVRDDISWSDERVTSLLYGPGGLPCEVNYKECSKTVILDADALKNLPEKLSPNYILTPHEGEFDKAFPDLVGTKSKKAIEAAQKINAIIVLKGAETIIAHPDGRIVINNHASPYLASAGTGDFLAGMITGLAAQGVEPFYAACAAVWMHGEACRLIGAGLVASDIEGRIPKILKDQGF